MAMIGWSVGSIQVSVIKMASRSLSTASSSNSGTLFLIE